MKEYVSIVLVALFTVLFGVMGTVSAAIITTDLNQSSDSSADSGPYATVTLSDNISGGVHFDVKTDTDVSASALYLMRNFYFNTNLLNLASSDISGISVTSSESGVIYSPTVYFNKNVSAFGIFSIEMDKTGPTGTHSVKELAFDINTGNVGDYFVANSDGYHFAAQILQPNSDGLTYFVTDGGTAKVPEPSTLLLLGCGLLGLGLFGRKKFKE